MVRYITLILASLLVLTGCGNNRQAKSMAITVNLRYTGTDGNARKFAEEMISSGTVDAIRAEEGNMRYEYYQSLDDPETILLIDSWANQEAIDVHHASPMMSTIAALREKYDLHMTVERYNRREIFEAPDSNLNCGLNLIAEGRYLEGDDPFMENDRESSAKNGNRTLRIIAICSFILAVISVCSLARRSKSR